MYSVPFFRPIGPRLWATAKESPGTTLDFTLPAEVLLNGRPTEP